MVKESIVVNKNSIWSIEDDSKQVCSEHLNLMIVMLCVVIMMKLNMYVMSMLTFRRSNIGENWKLQPVCCYHDDSEHVCYKYADL